MTNIYIFWLGDESVKNRIKIKVKELKSSEYDFILGPTPDEHNFLYKEFKHYRVNFENKRFAFCSDVWRIWKLYENGGFYLDANMLFTIKDDKKFYMYLDSFKENKIVVMEESSFYLLNGFMKFDKNNYVLEKIIHFYKNNSTDKTGPHVFTYFLIKNKIFKSINEKNKQNKMVKFVHCKDFDYRIKDAPINIASSGSWHNKKGKYTQLEIDACWFPLFDFYDNNHKFLTLRVFLFRLRKFWLVKLK